MTCRSQALQEHASANLGLEAIIRKALMGKYDQGAEPPPLSAHAFNPLTASASLPAAMPITAADGRSDHTLTSPGLQAPSVPTPSVPAPVSFVLCVLWPPELWSLTLSLCLFDVVLEPANPKPGPWHPAWPLLPTRP